MRHLKSKCITNKNGKTAFGSLQYQAERGIELADRPQIFRTEVLPHFVGSLFSHLFICSFGLSFTRPFVHSSICPCSLSLSPPSQVTINSLGSTAAKMISAASLVAKEATEERLNIIGMVPARSAYETAAALVKATRQSALLAHDEKSTMQNDAYIALVMTTNQLGLSLPGASSQALKPDSLLGDDGCLVVADVNYKFFEAARNLGTSTDPEIRNAAFSDEEKARVLREVKGLVKLQWGGNPCVIAKVRVAKATSLVIRNAASRRTETKHPDTDDGKLQAAVDQDALRLSLQEVQAVQHASDEALVKMTKEMAPWSRDNPRSVHALAFAEEQLGLLNFSYPSVAKLLARIEAAKRGAAAEEAVESGDIDVGGVAGDATDDPPGDDAADDSSGDDAADDPPAADYDADDGGSDMERDTGKVIDRTLVCLAGC